MKNLMQSAQYITSRDKLRRAKALLSYRGKELLWQHIRLKVPWTPRNLTLLWNGII